MVIRRPSREGPLLIAQALALQKRDSVKHRIFATLSSLLTLLTISVVLLWIRAQWYEEAGTLHALNTKLIVHCDQHKMILQLVPNCPTKASTPLIDRYPPIRQESRWGGHLQSQAIGFGYGSGRFHGQTVRNAPTYFLGIPYWFVAAIFFIISAILFTKYLSRHHGLCPKCGYDLRASTGACPECGTPMTVQ